MKETFVERKFKAETLKLIGQSNAIIAYYRTIGITLTLRALYYRLVKDNIIANKQSEYKRLGSILNDARLAGLVDWEAMEDRTRNLVPQNAWEDPAHFMKTVASQYKIDPWDQQTSYVEVWIEKDAAIGTIEGVCRKLRLPYFSCRGYTSQSELYVAGKRLASVSEHGRTPIIIHLGDHDPSGIDMSRDIASRLEMFTYENIEVRRILLNMDQVQQYSLPPNPLKEDASGNLTDSRGLSYRDQFGDESWELDALDPLVIARLIEDEFDDIVDAEIWDASMAQEEAERGKLVEAAERWDDVEEFLASGDEPEED